MAGGADDQRFLVLGAESGDGGRGFVQAEIDHDISLPDHGSQVVALIDLADHLQFGQARRTGQQRLTHTAFGTRNDDFGHT